MRPPPLREVDGEGAGEIEGSLGGIAPDRAGRPIEVMTLAESPESDPLEATTRIEDRLERE